MNSRRRPADLDRLQAFEAADAVVLVHDEVADLEVAEVGEEAARPAPAAAVEVHFLRKHVAVREDAQGQVGELEPRPQDSQPDFDGGAFPDGRGRPRAARP